MRKFLFFYRSCKNFENPGDENWITSGILGSRDAVLVFRTSALNRKAKQILDNDSCPVESIESTSIHSAESGSNNNVGICFSKSGSQISGIPNPSTSENVQMCFEKDKMNVMRTPKKFINIVMSEKKLCDSLSSSDYSISSEGDELDDIEKDVALQMNTLNDSESSEEEAIAVGDEDKEDFDDYPPADGMPASDLKLTYKFIQTERRLLRKIFTRHGLREADDNENYSILWTGVHIKPDILRNLAPYQRVNRFPRYIHFSYTHTYIHI